VQKAKEELLYGGLQYTAWKERRIDKCGLVLFYAFFLKPVPRGMGFFVKRVGIFN